MKAPCYMPKHVGEWLTFVEHILVQVNLVMPINTRCAVSDNKQTKAYCVKLFVLSVCVVANLAGLLAAHVSDVPEAVIHENRRQ